MKNLNKLPIVKPSNDIDPNVLSCGLNADKLYIVVGEVGSTEHYILLDFITGSIIPGMWNLKHFVHLEEDVD